MNQPDLGKKIVELRKAKGLTQEELVEKCNLNVRTLQRIESGEVIPRSYTLKTIFTALDFNVYDSLVITQNKFIKTGFMISIWLEQFYRYVIDLFNLKTNTMKKITILTIILSAIVFGIFAINTKSAAQNNENKKQKSIASASDKPAKALAFSYISCEECFGIGEQKTLVGRDVYFELNGVKAKFSLISLDKDTREFEGSFKGKLLPNKVELMCLQDHIINGNIKYKADKIQENDEKIVLVGHAKVEAKNGWIESEEILITLK